ncbi:hypothetical protein BC835DRAFT_631552 [Cytidiella melzeri]|nr:hypothetical protein BC835DRAFT_631552 [Cytidiella melzeri]
MHGRGVFVSEGPSNTLGAPAKCLILYYGQNEHAGIRQSRVKFVIASNKDLKRLSDACDSTIFGGSQELDQIYRSAGKLDAIHFAIRLYPGSRVYVGIMAAV